MKLEWKDRFKEMNSIKLFEIFSETKRINIDPQIFAGNLLIERNYKLEKLKKVKLNLIESINESFERKYHTDPKKVKREYIITKIIIRLFYSFLIIIPYFIFQDKINPDYSTLYKILFAVLLIVNFLPVLTTIKKGTEKAIKHVEKNLEKKNKLIEKIEKDLKI